MNGKITYVTLESDAGMHTSYEVALPAVERMLGHHHPLYIGGKGFEPTGEFEVRSPVDRDIVIGRFQSGGEKEAHAAIRVAKDTFPRWSGTDPAERLKILRRAADRLQEEMYSLAALITLEAGKTRTEAVAEVGEAIDLIRYHCSVYEQSDHFTVPMGSGRAGRSRSVMRPSGDRSAGA
ncbi:aldehyde dehydrogenase family protein [Methanofollis fontis]|uniref:Aldehyde dehydrogenase domain-containing protein n=1 Tax=Methanofollis fontis TaxID=2052832 RepID=A0A483CRQ9_9EURY|nr:aldehyde dehydrogenase family protein [Methanofollis fontis]TAJ43800.1 hypothetical protein CUJ86_06955 [Methanofollis fontis]